MSRQEVSDCGLRGLVKTPTPPTREQEESPVASTLAEYFMISVTWSLCWRKHPLYKGSSSPACTGQSASSSGPSIKRWWCHGLGGGCVPGAGWITWRENLSAYWLILDQKRVQTTGKYTPVLHSHFISHQTSRQTYTAVSRFKLCHFDNFSLTFPVYIIGNVKICIYLSFWILSDERIHNYT